MSNVPGQPLEVVAPLVPRSYLPLGGLLVIALVWIGLLTFLAIGSANPVTLNVVQIRAADLVLQGRLLAGEPPRFSVEQQWPVLASTISADPRQLIGTEITLISPLAKMPVGESLLLPVWFTSTTNEFAIVQGPQQVPAPGNLSRYSPHQEERQFYVVNVPGSCYPATDQSREQLAQVLSAP